MNIPPLNDPGIYSGVRVGAGVKFDAGKPRWSLLPWGAVRHIVDVLTYGAKKYADNNWMKVPEWKDRYDSALERHLVAWRSGEWLDPETKMPHLAHAGACLLFLLSLEVENGPNPAQVSNDLSP